jgi:hypothetical protein
LTGQVQQLPQVPQSSQLPSAQESQVSQAEQECAIPKSSLQSEHQSQTGQITSASSSHIKQEAGDWFSAEITVSNEISITNARNEERSCFFIDYFTYLIFFICFRFFA